MADITVDNNLMESAWDSPVTTENDTTKLPPHLDQESKEHYQDINVRPYFAHLAMEQEKIRDGKVLAKNSEIREVRNKIHTITDFLDHSHYAMNNQTGDTIVMTEHADLLFRLKGMLPEHAAKMLDGKSTFTRRELQTLCQMMTRRIDSEYTPQIEALKDDIFDIMQNLDKILPILKDLCKRYDDHINYINRQPK